jgi:VIT1/CCC1 family predicted Fe2+/Mn2+ transporter
MSAPDMPAEQHRTSRIGWLRASVLGANDGILSTGSLIVGVAAAQSSHQSILIAGVSSLVAGAMSMAAGEFVSVSSQSDTESADLQRERLELKNNPKVELNELAEIYEGRGLEPGLARQVAEQLMAHDALSAHARDELGIFPEVRARPVQAALASAASFAAGAALPLLLIFVVPNENLVPSVIIASLVFLGLLGALAAGTGGASILRGAMRVVFWGALAMSLTAAIGKVSGAIL